MNDPVGDFVKVSVNVSSGVKVTVDDNAWERLKVSDEDPLIEIDKDSEAELLAEAEVVHDIVAVSSSVSDSDHE